MALLEARDVVSGYGDAQILHGVSMNVRNDEIVCIIGPNGAGKSTLMKAVFGLIDCWEGSVAFDGADITGHRPDEITREGMCYVPQTDNVFPNLTVRENLEMGAYILDDVPERALDEVFARFPILEERRNQKAGTMSGGQQQMLAMGRGLMVDPALMLVDEPSAGLAPDLVDEVFEKILAINESGTAVLMVEQNARKALRNSDRGYVLEMGENRFEDTGAALLENDEVIDLYLGGGGGTSGEAAGD
ncbi:ABC transporter ATP-binding protein [Halorussus salilacus]|uniref:ABC transporter ATP-binding protein n=1 Tax=Halorussus salilacus TaxID=2953750 RepID=UPI00209DC363|nr:ABC transporter ATP-binding protein [Halorussus salilacus]USZ68143.1 ABC transporter ATP-binding protein [Halorussus salilacus]